MIRWTSALVPLLLVACTPADDLGRVDAIAPTTTPWAPPDAPGPWPVGARTEHLDDPRVGPLTLEIWYPAAPPEGAEISPYPDLPLLPLPGVYRNVPPAGADHPVVLFSHGYGGTRHQSVFLTEHLAAHGFVVVGVDHRLNTALDLDEDHTAVVALRRPVDLQAAADFVLDALGADWLAGRLSDGAIAVVGHSFGAFTGLVSGGGHLDLEAAIEACAADDPAGCGFVEGLDLTGLDVPAPDARVAATVLLAPGGWYAFGDTGLDHMAQTLIIGGRLDGDLPYDEEIRPTWERAGGSLATLERAGHWGFADLCALLPVADCAGEAAGFMDPLAVQAVTRALTVAFVGRHLAGDTRYDPWLDGSPFVADPDVTWEAGP